MGEPSSGGGEVPGSSPASSSPPPSFGGGVSPGSVSSGGVGSPSSGGVPGSVSAGGAGSPSSGGVPGSVAGGAGSSPAAGGTVPFSSSVPSAPVPSSVPAPGGVSSSLDAGPSSAELPSAEPSPTEPSSAELSSAGPPATVSGSSEVAGSLSEPGWSGAVENDGLLELPLTSGASASSRRSSCASSFSSWACAAGSLNFSETFAAPSHAPKSSTSFPSCTCNRPSSWMMPRSEITSPSGVANTSVTSVPGALVSSSCISPAEMVPQPTSVLCPASVIISCVSSERPSATDSEPNRTPSKTETIPKTLFTKTFHGLRHLESAFLGCSKKGVTFLES